MRPPVCTLFGDVGLPARSLASLSPGTAPNFPTGMPIFSCAAWTVDQKLHTFVAAPTDSPSGPPADVWRLRQPAAEQQPEVVQQVGCYSGRVGLVAVGEVNARGYPSGTAEVGLESFITQLAHEATLPALHSRCWPTPAQASGGVNVVVKAGQVAVQLQDAFHVPLLELCLGAGGCFGWAFLAERSVVRLGACR